MYNTRDEITKVAYGISDLKDELCKEHETTVTVVEQMKREFKEVVTAQREEILRLSFELERVHKAERRRRLAAIRRLKSE